MQFISVWSKETVINMDLNNKRKHYVKIDSTTSSDKILALLEEVESNDEDDIENLMNDSDTEFLLKKVWRKHFQRKKVYQLVSLHLKPIIML